MPKVSQNALSETMQREIFSSLLNTLSKIREHKLLESFLNDLLTPTEKTMLAKRFTAALMLQQGYSYTAICKVLKISKVTINAVQRELIKRGDGYRKVFETFFKQSEGKKFTDWLERVFEAAKLPIKGSPSSMRKWRSAVTRL